MDGDARSGMRLSPQRTTQSRRRDFTCRARHAAIPRASLLPVAHFAFPMADAPAAILMPTAAPICRVCGTSRPAGVDQCPGCGASESQCRRLRRRSDARWEALARQLRGRLAWFVLGSGLSVVLWVFLAMGWLMGRNRWISEHPVHLQRPSDAQLEIERYAVVFVSLLPWLAAAVALDRALRRLPTWKLASTRWGDRLPTSTLLVLGVVAQINGDWNVDRPSRLIGPIAVAVCVFSIFRLTQVTRQMDRWVEADRRAGQGLPPGVPVRLPIRRRLQLATAAVAGIAVAVLGSGAPLAVGLGAFVAWALVCLAAIRALGRWLGA